GRRKRGSPRRTPEQPARHGDARRMAHSGGEGLEVVGQQQARRERPTAQRGSVADSAASRRPEPQDALSARTDQSHIARVCTDGPAGATRGFWPPADWVLCRAPTGGPPVARPVEPGTQPLATGVPRRVGLLSGYGNAIVPQVAATFIVAALEAIDLG